MKSTVTAHTASNADSDCQTLYESSDRLVACADKVRKAVVRQTDCHTQRLGQVQCLGMHSPSCYICKLHSE